jgi:hypothetical protein
MPRKRPEKDTPRSPPPPLRVLPMQLQLGDVLADELSEWRLIGWPYTTVGGKTVNARGRA